MIYFIQSGERGPVKIGYVQSGRSVDTRLAELQVGNPEQLRLLATAQGGPSTERKFHRAFSATRIRGEWFAWSPLLQRVVAAYQLNPDADYFGADHGPIQRRKLPSLRTLQRRAAKAAFDRAVEDGSMTIRYEDAGGPLDNDAEN